MRDWIEEAKRADLSAVAARLGLDVRRGHRTTLACPACGATRRGSQDRRLPVSAVGTGGWRCWACGATGSTVDLVAYALEGARYSGGMTRVREWFGGSVEVDALPRAQAPTPERRLGRGDVDRFLALTAPVEDDAEVAGWLARRLGGASAAVCSLVRALPVGAPVPEWARYRGESWGGTGHRAIVPAWDAGGQAVGVRARLVRSTSSAPKTLPPAGYGCGGLVLACPLGVAMLRGEAAVSRVVICEGEPAWLAWVAASPATAPWAVFGVGSGWWSQAHADRVPAGARVLVATDHDEAGQRYAEQVTRTLHGRAEISRWSPPVRRATNSHREGATT